MTGWEFIKQGRSAKMTKTISRFSRLILSLSIVLSLCLLLVATLENRYPDVYWARRSLSNANAGASIVKEHNTPELDGITVTLNSTHVEFDVEPIMEGDSVLVPFRAILEAFGAEVGWDSDTQTVSTNKDGLDVSLQIGAPRITANGKTTLLDVAPKIVNERTLVPIRAVSEALGAKVDWDAKTKQVIITTK